MKIKGLLSAPWSPAFTQIDMKDSLLRIKDGNAHTLIVVIGEGNFTYTERVERQYSLDRGALNEVRNGDEVPVDVRFDFTWEYLKSPSSASDSLGTPTVEDALKNSGAAADWASSDTVDACRPYAVDLELEYIPNCATGDKEVITLSDFRYEQLDQDLRAGTVAVTGKCNITEATVVRSAQ